MQTQTNWPTCAAAEPSWWKFHTKTQSTREEFEFALRTLAETKAAGWDDVVAEQYKY